MLIGSVTDVEDFNKLEESRRNDALQAMLDEFRVNPVIDKEIQNNPVIMRELAQAVSRTFAPRKQLAADFKVKQ